MIREALGLVRQGLTEEAEKKFREAVDQQVVSAWHYLDQFLVDDGRFEDRESALKAAMENGTREASWRLREFYLELGRIAEARWALERGAELGHGRCQAVLGASLIEELDHAGARVWLKRAAEAGNQGAALDLCELAQRSVDKSAIEETLAWALRACPLDTQFTIGRRMVEELEVPAGLELLRKAATGGHSDASALLARLDEWLEELGVDEDGGLLTTTPYWELEVYQDQSETISNNPPDDCECLETSAREQGCRCEDVEECECGGWDFGYTHDCLEELGEDYVEGFEALLRFFCDAEWRGRAHGTFLEATTRIGPMAEVDAIEIEMCIRNGLVDSQVTLTREPHRVPLKRPGSR